MFSSSVIRYRSLTSVSNSINAAKVHGRLVSKLNSGRRGATRSVSGLTGECAPEALCSPCRADQAFLRNAVRPQPPNGLAPLRAVDLFSGCGGMSLGLEEAARRNGLPFEVLLAADSDADAMTIFKRNLPYRTATVSRVEELFPGAIGDPANPSERELAARIHGVDVLIGGPPCQGHSDLNNHTRRKDPKNALYLRMARAAEILKPNVVVIENVSAVQWDEGKVVHETSGALERSGYSVAGKVLDLSRIGVPQRRRRFVLLASRLETIRPGVVLDSLAAGMNSHTERTVRWAIHDLLDVDAREIFDTASSPTEANRKRIQFLFDHGCFNLPNEQRPECHQDGDHSYNSVYGRLWWNKAAQTVTTGFGCMGQGRYVHPQRRRTITPHEAARLQTFPDWYRFGEDTRRGVLAKAIGNAVPPLLMIALGQHIIPQLAKVRAQEE